MRLHHRTAVPELVRIAWNDRIRDAERLGRGSSRAEPLPDEVLNEDLSRSNVNWCPAGDCGDPASTDNGSDVGASTVTGHQEGLSRPMALQSSPEIPCR